MRAARIRCWNASCPGNSVPDNSCPDNQVTERRRVCIESGYCPGVAGRFESALKAARLPAAPKVPQNQSRLQPLSNAVDVEASFSANYSAAEGFILKLTLENHRDASQKPV